MKLTFEIYLTQKYISKDEWFKFIKTISSFNGFLKSWKIIITKEKNQIRYFIKTNRVIPPTINNLSSFLLKQTEKISLPTFKYSLASIQKIDSNIIDIINHCEIKNTGKFKMLEITILNVSENKILSRTNYFVEKNNKIIRYHPLLTTPTTILSVNFESNKRYFYKNTPKYLKINKILNLLNSNHNDSILNIDTFPYLEGNYYINQTNFNFDKHSIIIGSSGCGKSKFICSLIYNIYKNNELRQKYKIIVIDPHSSLENDIGKIAKIIDFNTINNSIDLFKSNNKDLISSTELLLELFKSIINTQYNSKLERVLRHSLYLLQKNNSFTFSNFRKLILNTEYRNNILRKNKDIIPNSVIDFFLSDFNDLRNKSYSETISPIISFIDEMEMIPIFNKEQNTDSLVKTINNNFLTLFSLNRITLGDKITKTISGLIMEQLLTIIQNHEINEHIIFIIDEITIVENPILKRYLSESRKYNLSLILIGQYFDQISEELKTSIFANTINYYIFRVAKKDASSLIENINLKIPLDDTKETKIKLLTELNNRECIARIEANGILLPAFKAKTLDYKSLPRKKETQEEIIKKENIKIENNFKINTDIKLQDLLSSNYSEKKGITYNE